MYDDTRVLQLEEEAEALKEGLQLIIQILATAGAPGVRLQLWRYLDDLIATRDTMAEDAPGRAARQMQIEWLEAHRKSEGL